MNLDFTKIETTYQAWQYYQSVIDSAFWEGFSDAERLKVLVNHSHPEMDHLIRILMGGKNLPDLKTMNMLDKVAFIGQFFDEHPGAKLEPKDLVRTCYRITGIFRMDLKNGKRHVVDFNNKWSLSDAKRRLAEIQHAANEEMRLKKVKASADWATPQLEYHSDYDLLALRIESRKVTPWSEAGE